MKIGFDSKRLFCNYTGLGNYSRTLLRNLGRFYPDHEYHLYTPEFRDTPEIRPFLENPPYTAHISGALFKSYWRTFSIKKQLKRDEIELYHGLSNEIPAGIHQTGIKSVVTIHDVIFRVHPETYTAIDRKIYDLKFRYACEHADRIIAISESTKNDIIRFYGTGPDKIEVIHQACNPLYYKLRSHPENDRILKEYMLPANYLLTVGRVEKRKNLKTLIESVGQLKPDIRLPLVVVGKGGRYKREAEQLARKSGLAGSVIWIDGITDTAHLQAIYQNAKILIYPSLYEGFGLPVTEALLSRTPVITSDRSSMKEAGGPGSIYINPMEPEQIARAIEKVMTNDGFREEMIETGYQYAHQYFAPELLTGQIMDCYRRVAGRPA